MTVSEAIRELQKIQEQFRGQDTNGADMDCPIWLANGAGRLTGFAVKYNNQLPPHVVAQ